MNDKTTAVLEWLKKKDQDGKLLLTQKDCEDRLLLPASQWGQPEYDAIKVVWSNLQDGILKPSKCWFEALNIYRPKPSEDVVNAVKDLIEVSKLNGPYEISEESAMRMRCLAAGAAHFKPEPKHGPLSPAFTDEEFIPLPSIVGVSKAKLQEFNRLCDMYFGELIASGA